MLALYICIALALTKSTVCGQALSEDELDIKDHPRRQVQSGGYIGYAQCKRKNNQYKNENERYRQENAILKDYIHGLQKSLQDKPEAAVEEGLDPVQDCADILRFNPEARSGLHNIHIHNVGGQSETVLVYCDMETEGGGWTVIQRRQNDAINFNRDFQTYQEGFGVMTNDFWFGNENLAMVTSRWNYELRIELENFQGETRTANYKLFRINCGNYQMEVDFYSGDAGDALSVNNGMFFTTLDNDMDLHTDINCASHHQGAWWHNACTRANLNGLYNTNPVSDERGIFWYDWEEHMSLKSTEMKIRPASIEQTNIPRDCADILRNNPLAASGQYTVPILENDCIMRSLNVYCDMDTDGGGWTVFQRRTDGSVDFFRNYQSYMDGFGDVTGEFWLGNENLHLLTNGYEQDLRFDLMDENNDTRYAQYASFRVGSYDDGYIINFTTYSGTAGDAFFHSNRMKFTTYDRDQDTWPGNCAEHFQGAWWYLNCANVNLNGRHHAQSPPSDIQGLWWLAWTGSGSREHMRFTEMKIRPSTSCHP